MSPDNEKLLLDHNYDGIQEYDNPMPRWWVIMFWISIFISPIYVLYYHAGPGNLVIDQYNQDMIAYYDLQAQQIAAMGEITEMTFVELQSNDAMMSGAAQLFIAKCAQCHGNNGEGGIGPNLTDDYWLHGSQMADIYLTVTDGIPSKGMQAWKNQLTLAEMLSVASYVGTMRGTQPANAKAPQGELLPYVLPVPEETLEDENEAEPSEATGV